MPDSVKITRPRPCDICQMTNLPGDPVPDATVDGKTTSGPWANMCDAHFESMGVGLGTGRGQRLILEGA